MQVNRLFLGLFVCVSMCACSDNDSEPMSGDGPKVFDGDEAYISVRLSDAGSMTRAAAGNPEYEYGTAEEHAVKDAYFYFYDENGVYVSQGSAWNGGSDGTDANVEFNGNNVVVLKGLTKKNYPMYMVTVLNRPASFTPGETLDEMEKTLANQSATGIKDEEGNFVMSTTSWAGQKNAQGADMKYFVTEVKESNFFVSSSDIAENPDNYVKVYVERLAAKVTLRMSSTLPTKVINGEDYYEITSTVAGEGNDNNTNVPTGSHTATEKLYVKVLGWKLNATAKHSNIVKNIDENWDNTETGSLGFKWNVGDLYRSFWGKSFNYGLSKYTYPTTALGYDEDDEDCPLNYYSLENDVLELGKSDYCAENTNTSAIVTANYPNAVTGIMLKAMVCDANGNPLDLVRFNGILFEKGSFLEYVLNVLKSKNNLNVWVATAGANGTTYSQIDKSYVTLTNAGDGRVLVQLNVENGVTLYERTGSEGNYTYTAISNYANFNDILKSESMGAKGYTGGLMHYDIPIEHLNQSTATNPIPEAKYGVVRNHHYVVTVNTLENVGKGIYDPTEVIVPGGGGGDEDDDVYYVRATIDILSWKVIDQSVKL